MDNQQKILFKIAIKEILLANNNNWSTYLSSSKFKITVVSDLTPEIEDVNHLQTRYKELSNLVGIRLAGKLPEKQNVYVFPEEQYEMAKQFALETPKAQILVLWEGVLLPERKDNLIVEGWQFFVNLLEQYYPKKKKNGKSN